MDPPEKKSIIAGIVTHLLQVHYRKRITDGEAFKSLARGLTHSIMNRQEESAKDMVNEAMVEQSLSMYFHRKGPKFVYSGPESDPNPEITSILAKKSDKAGRKRPRDPRIQYRNHVSDINPPTIPTSVEYGMTGQYPNVPIIQPPQPRRPNHGNRGDTRKKFVPKVECEFWLKGTCKRGDNCTFAHTAPDPRAKENCKYMMGAGKCKYGDSCVYNHDVSAIPCKHYLMQRCFAGDQCRFSHAPMSTDERYKWLGELFDAQRHAREEVQQFKIESGESTEDTYLRTTIVVQNEDPFGLSGVPVLYTR